MKFLKYRNTWAWGNSNWEIELITFEDDYDIELLQDRVDSLNNKNDWSDKFRGIEYEVIDYPGHDWMKQNIITCKDRINYLTKLLGEYNALYYKNGGI